jgi:hypothetical protein
MLSRIRNAHRREPMSTMWQPLARARRRLGGAKPPAPSNGDDTIPATDLEFALNRADLERLMSVLATVPGVEPGRPDTPARLEAALRVAIASADGRGTPIVTRRPAGLYTPETWRIGVEGADRPTQLALARAIDGGGHV